MNLLRTELLRFRLRAFSWFAMGLLLLVAAGFAITAWHEARPPSAAALAAAHDAWEQDQARFDESVSQMIERCRTLRAEHPDVELRCDPPQPPELVMYEPVPRAFADAATSASSGLTLPVVLAALAASVSFVTAEFGTGSMATWLTFVPRRRRVFTSKTLAAMTAALPGAAVGIAGALGGMALVYAAYGRSLGDGALWSHLVDAAGRQMVLAVLAAAVGCGLAFTLRNVPAVTGVLVWWVVAIEMVLIEVLPSLAPLTLGLNARAWVEGGASYTVQECGPDLSRPGLSVCESVDRFVSAGQGVVVLTVAALVVAAAGLLVFRRRDVA